MPSAVKRGNTTLIITRNKCRNISTSRSILSLTIKRLPYTTMEDKIKIKKKVKPKNRIHRTKEQPPTSENQYPKLKTQLQISCTT